MTAWKANHVSPSYTRDTRLQQTKALGAHGVMKFIYVDTLQSTLAVTKWERYGDFFSDNNMK